jgi:hypothetical protein
MVQILVFAKKYAIPKLQSAIINHKSKIRNPKSTTVSAFLSAGLKK